MSAKVRKEGMLRKLDGVGPIANRPSTDKLHHFVRQKKNLKCDMWHVTYDTWHVTCLGGWTFSQNFRSLALTVCDLWYYVDLEEKADLMNQLINYEVVDRTAPATPGLLNTYQYFKSGWYCSIFHCQTPDFYWHSTPVGHRYQGFHISRLCFGDEWRRKKIVLVHN